MSPLRLELQRRDIVSVQADVCVSSIHRSKDLNKGPLPKHILKSGGQSVQDELFKRDPGKELKMGQVEVVSSGKLQNFKELNFICLRTYQPGNEQILLQSILECLELAAVKNHKSVAFPALGLGHSFPAKIVADCLVEAATLHNYQYPETSLEVVYIVLLDQDKEVIKTFLLMCARGTTDLKSDTTNQLPSSDVHDLDDNELDLQLGGTHNFDRSDKKAYSGAVNAGAPQLAATHPPHVPNVMGQKKKANLPLRANPFSAFVNFVKGISYSVNASHFNLSVKPKISKRIVGVQLEFGVDISFLDPFIPASLKPFWQSITR